MNHSLPLHDKKILVPRAEKQANSFSKLLMKYGGIPVEIPLIAFRPTNMNLKIQAALEKLHTYDWIIFTSNITVETLISFIGLEQISTFPKIAVIGKKTKEILNGKGMKVDFIPSKYVAETFVEEFLPKVYKGMNIFIPKGNLAREYITESLRQHGAIVDEAIIYETYMPDESRKMLAKKIAKKDLDILLFTSPSTVDHFMDVIKQYNLENQLEHCIIGCIGPVTENKIKLYGLSVHAAPKVYTVEEMIKSMIAYLENR